jgi:hypothetical protein
MSKNIGQEMGQDHFVTFYASQTKLSQRNPGHSFQAFGVHDHVKQECRSYGAYGKYPSKQCNIFTTVSGCPGIVKSDEAHSHDNGRMVQVSQQQFQRALAAAKAPAGDYSLFKKNCVDRQNEVAKAAGLAPGDGGKPSDNFKTMQAKIP